MFKIREFIPGDETEIYALFRGAIHEICAKDYDEKQRAVFAPEKPDLSAWCESLSKNYTFVCVEESTGKIVGFADMEGNGYLDRGYVHKDYQARGIGLKLYKAVEAKAKELGIKLLYSDVSITAKRAMEFMGYKVEAEQTHERNGVRFINYRMSKDI